MSTNYLNNIIYKNFNDYSIGNTIDIKNVGEFLINPKIHNPDAHFKYCTIIDLIKNLNINIENILEAGCADSVLASYLCKLYNIKNAYLFDFDIVRGINIHERQNELFNFNNIRSNVIFKGGDFFKRIREIDDNSIDLIIDACSVTHFMGSSGMECWKTASKFFYDKLKSGGYIIISSDIKLTENLEMENSTEEFVYMKDIINCFIGQFEIISNPILSNDQPIEGLRVLSICFKKI